jgi:hypothetical protein
MALIVEDGTGLSTAEAMISVADATTYFTARSLVDSGEWTGTDAAKEAALRRGWQYIENAYRGRWKGARTVREQALAWPRMASVELSASSTDGAIYDQDGWYIESDEIPTQVKYANAEAALLVLQGVDLEPRLARSGDIKRKKVKAGPVETETEYGESASVRDRITTIEGYLSGLITSAPGAAFGQVPAVRG